MSYGDVRDQLVALPEHHGGNGYLTQEPPLFPPRFEIARFLEPRRVFEFGALYGYCLAAFMLGSPATIEAVGWVDNETHTIASNRRCLENLESLGIPIGEYRVCRDHYDTSLFGRAELVHVDSDHTAGGCLRDLIWAWTLEPRVILVDDWTADTHRNEIQGSTYAFADALEIPVFSVHTVNGLGVLDVANLGVRDHLASLGYEIEEHPKP